jgi:hypothetical protein
MVSFNFADLRGRRFDRHTVLKWAGYKYAWQCHCACGRITVVTASNLVTGHTTSCGCARIGRAGRRARDLTGKRFGKLKAIMRTANRGNHTAWRCRCDCGKVSIIRTDNLTDGRSKSCGCLQRERAGRPQKKPTEGSSRDLAHATAASNFYAGSRRSSQSTPVLLD